MTEEALRRLSPSADRDRERSPSVDSLGRVRDHKKDAELERERREKRERRKERDKLKKERARRAREEGVPLDADKAVVDEDAMEVDPVLGEAEVDEAAVMAALGFASFNTTKGKKVEDNVKTAAKGAAVVGKKRQYRQYMNRRGGFGGGGGGSSRGGR